MSGQNIVKGANSTGGDMSTPNRPPGGGGGGGNFIQAPDFDPRYNMPHSGSAGGPVDLGAMAQLPQGQGFSQGQGQVLAQLLASQLGLGSAAATAVAESNRPVGTSAFHQGNSSKVSFCIFVLFFLLIYCSPFS